MYNLSDLSTKRRIGLLGVLFLFMSLQMTLADTPEARQHDLQSSLIIHTFELSSYDAEAVAFNPHSNHIWIYGKQRLQAFQSNGNQVVDRLYPELPNMQTTVELLAEGERLWLVIGRVLYQFDITGALIQQRGFHKAIDAIHYDVKRAQLLIATPDYVIVLDRDGREIERVKVRLANIA